jgi:hypothetical protein
MSRLCGEMARLCGFVSRLCGEMARLCGLACPVYAGAEYSGADPSQGGPIAPCLPDHPCGFQFF